LRAEGGGTRFEVLMNALPEKIENLQP